MSSGLGSMALGAAGLSGCRAGGERGGGGRVTEIAGLPLKGLRDELRGMLFEEVLPFWDRHGIDHDKGGVMHALAHDGRVVSGDKKMWFQGRAIWAYSFLYNNFGKNEKYLDVARKTREFVLRYGLEPNGLFASLLDRDGAVKEPSSADFYGSQFVAEGLSEYYGATGDRESLDLAVETLLKVVDLLDKGVNLEEADGKKLRPQGTWMVTLLICTQTLRRLSEPRLEKLAARCVDMIINKHWNPEIRLNNEYLYLDGTRPTGDLENYCWIGHSIETLWMVMDEAVRIGNKELVATCIDRIRRHMEVGWDDVYDGLVSGVNVDRGDYDWGINQPVGTDFKYHAVGEYSHMRSQWSHNEILVALLLILEHTGADWAADWYGRFYEYTKEKFALEPYSYPLGILFSDRKVTSSMNITRKDNYHPVRQLMLNILSLERMIERA